MNEQQWQSCNDLELLLKNNFITNRKRQLIALACCRDIQHLSNDSRSKECLDEFELFVDGHIDIQELNKTKILANFVWDDAWDTYATNTVDSAFYEISKAALDTARAIRDVLYPSENFYYPNGIVGWCKQANPTGKYIEIVKDICNPFLTDINFCLEAKNIAQQVYNGDKDARFVLSDYLEEKGYPYEIVAHLKSGNHYKGCWLIDQILNK